MINILFALFFLIPNLAHAETNVINVEGLSFECQSCKKTDSNFCEVPWQGKTLTVLCDSLFEALLQRASDEQIKNYPKNEELLSLLSRQNVEEPISRLAFKILMLRNLETKFLQPLFDTILKKHLFLISEKISKNELSHEQNLILWSKRNFLPPKDVFLLAKNMPEMGIDEIFKELTVVDVESDRSFIEQLLAEKILSENERPVFQDLQKFIVNCSKSFSCKDFNPENPELIKYKSRLENSIISKAILEHKIKDKDAIRLLSNSSYIEHRTPETHEALVFVISEMLGNQKFKSLWKGLNDKEKDFVTFMAKNDSRVAKLVYGSEANTFYYWLIGAVLSVISSAIYFYIRAKKSESIKDAYMLRREIEELNEIWSFFELPIDANLKDLKQRYRILAREMHPDSEQGETEDFLKLNNYYKRAIELLTK